MYAKAASCSFKTWLNNFDLLGSWTWPAILNINFTT